jgi:hypothetical protein
MFVEMLSWVLNKFHRGNHRATIFHFHKLLFSFSRQPMLLLLLPPSSSSSSSSFSSSSSSLSLYFSLCFVRPAQSVEKQFCLLYVTFLFCFIKMSDDRNRGMLGGVC